MTVVELSQNLDKDELALRSGSSILSEVQTERWKLLIENYPNYPLRGSTGPLEHFLQSREGLEN